MKFTLFGVLLFVLIATTMGAFAPVGDLVKKLGDGVQHVKPVQPIGKMVSHLGTSLGANPNLGKVLPQSQPPSI